MMISLINLNKFLFFFSFFLTLSAFAQDAIVLKNTALFKEASISSGSLISIEAKKTVKIIEKKGFWVKIDFNGQSGWLKLNDIELPNIPTNADALSTGRTSSGNVVNTAGVRGLSPEDLKNSKPDTNAVEIAIKNNNLIKDADIASFISSAGLIIGSPDPQLKSVKTTMTGNVDAPENASSNNKSKQKNNSTQKTKEDENW